MADKHQAALVAVDRTSQAVNRFEVEVIRRLVLFAVTPAGASAQEQRCVPARPRNAKPGRTSSSRLGLAMQMVAITMRLFCPSDS